MVKSPHFWNSGLFEKLVDRLAGFLSGLGTTFEAGEKSELYSIPSLKEACIEQWKPCTRSRNTISSRVDVSGLKMRRLEAEDKLKSGITGVFDEFTRIVSQGKLEVHREISKITNGEKIDDTNAVFCSLKKKTTLQLKFLIP